MSLGFALASSLCAAFFLSCSSAPVTDIAINPNKCDKIDYEHAGVISPTQLPSIPKPIRKKVGDHSYTCPEISGCVRVCGLLADIIDYVV